MQCLNSCLPKCWSPKKDGTDFWRVGLMYQLQPSSPFLCPGNMLTVPCDMSKTFFVQSSESNWRPGLILALPLHQCSSEVGPTCVRVQRDLGQWGRMLKSDGVVELSKDSCCSFPKINKASFFIMLIRGWSSSVVAGKNDLKKFSKPGNSTLPPCSMEQDSPLCVLSMA